MQPLEKTDWTRTYNTTLTDEEENLFQTWLDKQQYFYDANSSNTVRFTCREFLVHYDLRGWWKYLQDSQNENELNFTRERKYDKPNCPTFSTESIYHGVDGHWGGEWKQVDVGMILPLEEFYPSVTNLEVVGVQGLIDRFAGSTFQKLILPIEIEKSIQDNRETDKNLN